MIPIDPDLVVLTVRQERAAALVAEDRLSNDAIAAEVGVKAATIERWKRRTAFRARVQAITEELRAAIVARGIADKQNRIDAANDRWRRMRQVIDERGEDPLMAEVAGGKTGLLVASPMLVKVFEAGADGDELTPTKQSVVLYEYAVDTGLLKELREHEKQAAIELQQWTEKRELDATESFIQALKEFGRGSGTG